MDLASVPETIRTIITQAGGLGLRGAFGFIGAHEITYRCPEPDGECRPSRPSRISTEGQSNFVDFEVGLGCLVNGKRGRKWTLVIAYEPDDTYTVWLVEGHDGRTAESMVLACHRDVYCDTLQITIEGAYDEAIRTHNEGFIPLD